MVHSTQAQGVVPWRRPWTDQLHAAARRMGGFTRLQPDRQPGWYCAIVTRKAG